MSSSERRGAMEDLLENISKNSDPKDNFYIVVNGTDSKIKNTFSPSLIEKGTKSH